MDKWQKDIEARLAELEQNLHAHLKGIAGDEELTALADLLACVELARQAGEAFDRRLDKISMATPPVKISVTIHAGSRDFPWVSTYHLPISSWPKVKQALMHEEDDSLEVAQQRCRHAWHNFKKALAENAEEAPAGLANAEEGRADLKTYCGDKDAITFTNFVPVECHQRIEPYQLGEK